MSHFLARLVERARGTVPQVEPMIAPRFAATPVSEILREVEAAAPVKSHEAHAARGKGPAEQETVRRENGRTQAHEIRDEEVNEPAEPERLLVPPEISKPEEASPIVRRILQEDVAAPAAAHHALPGQSFPEKRASRSGSSNPASTLDFSRRQRERFAPNESIEERPIVRVTIGRIDVRATLPPPAPPSKSAARPAPKLTLDGYLKERKEGAR
jgi:hypothetical protein